MFARIAGFFVLCAVICGFAGCQQAKPFVYDLTPDIAASSARPVLAPSNQAAGSTSIDVQYAATDSKHLGYAFHDDVMSTRGLGSPQLDAASNSDLKDVVRDLVAPCCKAKGINPAAQSDSTKHLTISISRIELVPPSRNDPNRRDAYLEASVSVIVDGKTAYERKIDVKAERVFSSAGDALEFVQGDLASATKNKEEDEGVQSLLTDLFSKFQDEMIADNGIWGPLSDKNK